jgi:hypothetical protein
MSESYEDLSRRAIKGDAEAVSELFSLGKKLEAEGRFQEATTAFSDAAIAYSTSADSRKGPLYLFGVREPVCIVGWLAGRSAGSHLTPPVPRAPDEDQCPGRVAATDVQ